LKLFFKITLISILVIVSIYNIYAFTDPNIKQIPMIIFFLISTLLVKMRMKKEDDEYKKSFEQDGADLENKNIEQSSLDIKKE
jgi:hypothetical protein